MIKKMWVFDDLTLSGSLFQHKKKISDQTSSCAQREDKERMEVSEEERSWWVRL